MEKLAVVALGGNALIEGDKISPQDQYKTAYKSAIEIAKLLKTGLKLVITHGNGPQVGFVLRRAELASSELPPVPIDFAVADTQGFIGSMFQRALTNLTREWPERPKFATVVTHVAVDPEDPDFKNPSKPVGSFISDKEKAEALAKQYGWELTYIPEKGYRRVVPSPKPMEILEGEVIREMVERGIVPIACGGGGIPVVRREDGSWEGVEAVIDKDRSSALLALKLGAERLYIATAEDRAYLNYNDPEKRQPLTRLNWREAEKYLEEGHFGRGSMAPKIEAAITFVKNGGKEAVIGHLSQLSTFSDPEVGTHVVNDEPILKMMNGK